MINEDLIMIIPSKTIGCQEDGISLKRKKRKYEKEKNRKKNIQHSTKHVTVKIVNLMPQIGKPSLNQKCRHKSPNNQNQKQILRYW